MLSLAVGLHLMALSSARIWVWASSQRVGLCTGDSNDLAFQFSARRVHPFMSPVSCTCGFSARGHRRLMLTQRSFSAGVPSRKRQVNPPVLRWAAKERRTSRLACLDHPVPKSCVSVSAAVLWCHLPNLQPLSKKRQGRRLSALPKVASLWRISNAPRYRLPTRSHELFRSPPVLHR